MAFKECKSSIRTVRPGDPGWTITDGMMVSQRAGFEIGSGCPSAYRQVIMECIDRGWLKPVGYMKDAELTWDILTG